MAKRKRNYYDIADGDDNQNFIVTYNIFYNSEKVGKIESFDYPTAYNNAKKFVQKIKGEKCDLSKIKILTV